MANLTGTGAPGRTTQAAIGDIYTDTTTGKKYKCTFAYGIDADKGYDTQWVELKGDTKEETSAEPSPEPNVEEVESAEPVKDVVKEETSAEPEQKKPKNYTNYSKAKNKQTAK